MNKNFKKYVSEAKQITALLKLKNHHRMKVAELAIKACSITHGGRRQFQRNTVKIFAEKININSKTLYEWIRIRKYIFNKIPKKLHEEFNELPAQEFRHIMKGLKEDEDSINVTKKFKTHLQQAPDHKVAKYLKVISSLLYNCRNGSRIMEISDELLLNIIKDCRTLVIYCEKEMDLRGKKIKREIKNPKINYDEFWEEEVKVQ